MVSNEKGNNMVFQIPLPCLHNPEELYACCIFLATLAYFRTTTISKNIDFYLITHFLCS